MRQPVERLMPGQEPVSILDILSLLYTANRTTSTTAGFVLAHGSKASEAIQQVLCSKLWEWHSSISSNQASEAVDLFPMSAISSIGLPPTLAAIGTLDDNQLTVMEALDRATTNIISIILFLEDSFIDAVRSGMPSASLSLHSKCTIILGSTHSRQEKIAHAIKELDPAMKKSDLHCRAFIEHAIFKFAMVLSLMRSEDRDRLASADSEFSLNFGKMSHFLDGLDYSQLLVEGMLYRDPPTFCCMHDIVDATVVTSNRIACLIEIPRVLPSDFKVTIGSSKLKELHEKLEQIHADVTQARESYMKTISSR